MYMLKQKGKLPGLLRDYIDDLAGGGPADVVDEMFTRLGRHLDIQMQNDDSGVYVMLSITYRIDYDPTGEFRCKILMRDYIDHIYRDFKADLGMTGNAELRKEKTPEFHETYQFGEDDETPGELAWCS